MAPPNFQMKIRASHRIAQKKRTRPITEPDVNEEESQHSSNANPNLPVQNNRSSNNQQSVAATQPKSRRQKLKAKNPAKYEEIRESDRKRSQLYRLEMTDAERVEYNRKAAIRQQRYRANKKAKEMEELKKAAQKKIEKGTMRMTRSEKDKINEKKKKDADRERRERAALTAKQYSEYLAKRRQAYAAKRDREREAKRQSSAIQTEEDANFDVTISDTTYPVTGPTYDDQPSTSSFQPPEPPSMSSSAGKRQERTRNSLPDDPNTYADMLEDMLNTESPTKVEALERRGLRNFKANEKRRSLEQELTEIIKKQAQKPGKKDMGAILKSLKEKRLQRYASKVLGINRKRIVKETKLKRGRREITEEDIDTICNFYESMANPLPDKRLVSNRTGKPQMVLSKPLDDVYKHFSKIHPEVKIKRTKFLKLRPRHVKQSRNAKYRGCLCERCENLRMKVTVLNQRMQADGYEAMTVKDVSSLVHLTLCPKQEGTDNFNLKCIKRECNDCGMHRFDEHYSDIAINHRSSAISWREWGVLEKADGKKRRGLKHCDDKTVNDLQVGLRKEVQEQALHVFNWKWQFHQYTHIKSHLPQGWVLNLWDFAENYTCFIQDEAQSAYWTRNQATIHPVVNFYNCETEGCNDTVCESIVFISPDNKHDYNAVHTYMDLATAHLHQKRNINIKMMVRFSDGCASQYKSFGPMADVAFSSVDYNFPTCHNFYGSRHGKGASDGESAVVKSKASSAVKCGTAVIGDGKQLYEYCINSLVKDTEEDKCTHFRRDFYFVDSDDIRRDNCWDPSTP